MRKLTLIAAAASALMAGSAVAAPSLYLAPAPTIDAVYIPGGQPLLQDVQYRWGGRNYCWYDGGWHGPGYYWCGYAGRRGFGWGGGPGWNGWGHGGGRYHGAGFDVHRGHVGGGDRHGGRGDHHVGGGGEHGGGDHHH